MTVFLTDHDITARLQRADDDPLRLRIDPYSAETIKRQGALSYGLTSGGYDARLGYKFISYGWSASPLDVTDPDSLCPEHHETSPDHPKLVLPAHGFLLGQTVERFRIPDDCHGVIFGRSTLCRLGLNLNTSTLEPGWEGVVTLELANLSGRDLVLRSGEGICQVIFWRSASPCQTPYYRKQHPSYQGARGIQLPHCPGADRSLPPS